MTQVVDASQLNRLSSDVQLLGKSIGLIVPDFWNHKYSR